LQGHLKVRPERGYAVEERNDLSQGAGNRYAGYTVYKDEDVEQQVQDLFDVLNHRVSEVPPVNWMVPFLLVCLQERDCHGHELAQNISNLGLEATHSEIMYGTLQHMENEGVLASEEDEFDRMLSSRTYSVTELGNVYLEYLANALMQYGEEVDLFLQIYSKQTTRSLN
jgi:poly-beta-hydroxybutyrate-responsive repressor